MDSNIMEVAEDRGLDVDVVNGSSDSVLVFSGDPCVVAEAIRESNVDDNRVGYGFVEDLEWLGLDVDGSVLVSIRDRESRELEVWEADALMGCPWVDYTGEYIVDDGDVLLTLDEDSRSLSGFDLVDFEMNDGEVFCRFRFSGPSEYSVAEFRAGRFLSLGDDSLECPECGDDLGYRDQMFSCFGCLSYFVQPSLFDGVELDDSEEEIYATVRDNFVRNPSLPDEDMFDLGIFLEDVGSPPTIVSSWFDSDFSESSVDDDTDSSIGFTEDYPPVYLEDGSVALFDVDDVGECWFTGAEAEHRVSLMLSQEFDSGVVYGQFRPFYASAEVIEQIESDLGLEE